MAYRPEWFRTDKSVLEMALDLHMLNTGSYEVFDADVIKQNLCDHLEYVLETWKEPTSKFDLRVKELIIEVLLESNKYQICYSCNGSGVAFGPPGEMLVCETCNGNKIYVRQ